MHHHGYLWVGPKARFDDEALRRPPHPDPPPGDARPELVRRYREVAAEFPVVDLPPLETAYWLVKPHTLVRGSWADPQEAASWLGEQLGAYAHRFASGAERTRNTMHVAGVVQSAAERLGWGGDVALGFYLDHPAFLSLTLVSCSPHHSRPELGCPLGPGGGIGFSTPAPGARRSEFGPWRF